MGLGAEPKGPPMARGYHRGHEMECHDAETWYYVADGVRVADDPDRDCGHCGIPQTREGHDGCLGTIPGAENACCGHGRPDEAYVTIGAIRYSGDEALEIFRIHGVGPQKAR